jgi:hypothetical protein
MEEEHADDLADLLVALPEESEGKTRAANRSERNAPRARGNAPTEIAIRLAL